MKKKTQLHTYELLSSMSLYTTVTVKGEQVDIFFTGGFIRPYIRRGFFSTSDPDIIKALEEDNSYNILWRKIHPINDEISDSDPVDTSETTDPNKVTDEDLTGYEINHGINTGQKARAFLLSKLEGKITSSDLRTNADIRKVAEEYKIRFTNWPVEE